LSQRAYTVRPDHSCPISQPLVRLVLAPWWWWAFAVLIPAIVTKTNVVASVCYRWK
jgi:hypothetical protein